MKYVLMFLFCCCSLSVSTQTHRNIELVSNVDLGEFTNDVWGYVDSSGIEYAIIGTRSRTIVYSLEDPSHPDSVYSVEGSSTTWRDIKHYNNYLYVIADQVNDGLTIINMSNPRDSITHSIYRPNIAIGDALARLGGCHNVYIDTETSLLFLAGCNGISSQGVLIFDLKDNPEEPQYLGAADIWYAHDVYAKGDFMYASEIYAGQLSIYDISDRTDPKLLGSVITSDDFTHNAWTSDDGQFIFTTDEVSNGWVDSYDISDPSNIIKLDRFRPLATDGEGGYVHNTHYYNGFLVTSWYSDGVIVTDASRPHNLIETGNYDTFNGFQGSNGCWGAYPFLPSGLILASDMSSGLFVLRPTYIKACHLEGNVTDKETGRPINGVDVQIIDGDLNEATTNALGEYSTGQVTAGEFDVEFYHPEYEMLTVAASLENGKLTKLDVQMSPKRKNTISGQVFNNTNGEPFPFADVVVLNDQFKYRTETDENGLFSIEVFEDEYNVIAGSWTYLHDQVEGVLVNGSTSVELRLDKGYQDDFIFDFGWTVTGNASTGFWVREKPFGAFYRSAYSNPNFDIDNDFGDECFVTGNEKTETAAFDDVDNGFTLLRSPLMDLTTYANPILEYDVWFFNAGGNGFPNDSLEVRINNGSDIAVLEIIKDSLTNNSLWRDRRSFNLKEYVEITDQMQIEVQISDDPESGHIVDGGFDAVRITGEFISNTDEVLEDPLSISIYPNPFTSQFMIKLNEIPDNGQVAVFDVLGRLRYSQEINNTTLEIDTQLEDGVYFLRIREEGIWSKSIKLIKQGTD